MVVAISWGGLPQCMLGYSPGCGPGDPLGVGFETPSWVWAWRHPGQTLQPSPGCGAGGPPWPDPSTSTWVCAWRPPGQTPNALPWVWCWRPTRHARIPLPRDLQGMLGYHPWKPPRQAGIPPARHAGIPPLLWTEFLTHTSENITLPQLHCGQ